MIALDALIEKHEDALAYDLIGLGLRLRQLGEDHFTWGDLGVIVRQAPRSSALYGSLYPDQAQWGMPEQLMALMADNLAVANWQRGGGKRADYPEPITRPGVEPKNKQFGKGAIPYDEMNEWLGW